MMLVCHCGGYVVCGTVAFVTYIQNRAPNSSDSARYSTISSPNRFGEREDARGAGRVGVGCDGRETGLPARRAARYSNSFSGDAVTSVTVSGITSASAAWR